MARQPSKVAAAKMPLVAGLTQINVHWVDTRTILQASDSDEQCCLGIVLVKES